MTRKNAARTAGVLLAPAVPLGVGVVIMRGGEVPAGLWLLNVTAAAGGLAMAAVALAWPGLASWRQGALRGAALAGVVLLGATLLAGGLEGVHRWLPLGPVRIHAGALLLPSVLVALLELPWITSVVVAFAALGVLWLQPDAAQAASFSAAWIGIVAIRGETRISWVTVGSALLAAACALRPDPLEPVLHVEGVVGMAVGQGLLPTLAAIVSLAVLPLAPVLLLERPVGRVLGVYILGLLVAAWLGNHPVPVLGYGVSPILGYYVAVTMALIFQPMPPCPPSTDSST